MSSGIAGHFEPSFVYHFSLIAVSIDTGGPFRTSPVALSVAYAKHTRFFNCFPFTAHTPCSFMSKRSGVYRPLALIAPIMYWADQLGLPWIMFRFCITASTDEPVRCATSSATRQFESFPL